MLSICAMLLFFFHLFIILRQKKNGIRFFFFFFLSTTWSIYFVLAKKNLMYIQDVLSRERIVSYPPPHNLIIFSSFYVLFIRIFFFKWHRPTDRPTDHVVVIVNNKLQQTFTFTCMYVIILYFITSLNEILQ
jgi:hypothetical protein